MSEIQTRNEGRSNTFLAVSILASAIIIGGSVVYGIGSRANQGLADVSANIPTTNGTGNSLPLDAGGNVLLGDPKAPLTIIVFGDYQCPFCEKMFQEAEQSIRKDYIETGKANLVYRDFPLEAIHPYARPAANAAECARDQGKYWLYHDTLFNRQNQLPSIDFVKLAGELGMDTKTFGSCFSASKYDAEIQRDYDAGVAAGVNGTPATFINGKLISGAVPFSYFKPEIEKAIQASNSIPTGAKE